MGVKSFETRRFTEWNSAVRRKHGLVDRYVDARYESRFRRGKLRVYGNARNISPSSRGDFSRLFWLLVTCTLRYFGNSLVTGNPFFPINFHFARRDEYGMLWNYRACAPNLQIVPARGKLIKKPFECVYVYIDSTGYYKSSHTRLKLRGISGFRKSFGSSSDHQVGIGQEIGQDTLKREGSENSSRCRFSSESTRRLRSSR